MCWTLKIICKKCKMLNYTQIIACFCCFYCFVDDSNLFAHYLYSKLKYSYGIDAVENRYTPTGKRIDETSQFITRTNTILKALLDEKTHVSDLRQVCDIHLNCYLYILGERQFAPASLIQSHAAIKQVIWSSKVCANVVTCLFYCENRAISLFFL